jgi:RNA polymerase sigma-70 factor (ECF subfamily)
MTSVSDPPLRTSDAFEAVFERHRSALLRYCYRMLGSSADADDAVQETMVRAWRGLDAFEGRAPVEAWLYRIATNVCLNLLRGRRRRALPMDLASPSAPSAVLGPELSSEVWVDPFADTGEDHGADPADAAARRESVRLAFVAALQHLPPRQRAVLILRDVLRWRTGEVAELTGMTQVSVKSALQRARATLSSHPPAAGGPVDQELLDRYVDAFGRYDMDALVRLLRDDAVLTMPPLEFWVAGAAAIGTLWTRLAEECHGGSQFRTIAVSGTMGFVQFLPPSPGAIPEPFAVHVLEAIDGAISAIHVFRDPVIAARLAG